MIKYFNNFYMYVCKIEYSNYKSKMNIKAWSKRNGSTLMFLFYTSLESSFSRYFDIVK